MRKKKVAIDYNLVYKANYYSILHRYSKERRKLKRFFIVNKGYSENMYTLLTKIRIEIPFTKIKLSNYSHLKLYKTNAVNTLSSKGYEIHRYFLAAQKYSNAYY